jgi:hypothetical protein
LSCAEMALPARTASTTVIAMVSMLLPLIVSPSL